VYEQNPTVYSGFSSWNNSQLGGGGGTGEGDAQEDCQRMSRRGVRKLGKTRPASLIPFYYAVHGEGLGGKGKGTQKKEGRDSNFGGGKEVECIR